MKRGWTDIEPKITFALGSGAVAAFIIKIAALYGYELPADIQNIITLVCAGLGGYLTPSVGTTVIQPSEDKVIERHSGNVTVFTGSTPIQQANGTIETPFWSAASPTAQDDQATIAYGDR